jgi:hypothetical protein
MRDVFIQCPVCGDSSDMAHHISNSNRHACPNRRCWRYNLQRRNDGFRRDGTIVLTENCGTMYVIPRDLTPALSTVTPLKFGDRGRLVVDITYYGGGRRRFSVLPQYPRGQDDPRQPTWWEVEID